MEQFLPSVRLKTNELFYKWLSETQRSDQIKELIRLIKSGQISKQNETQSVFKVSQFNEKLQPNFVCLSQLPKPMQLIFTLRMIMTIVLKGLQPCQLHKTHTTQITDNTVTTYVTSQPHAQQSPIASSQIQFK